MNNKIYACSDLHAGDGSKRDDWTAEERENFIETLPRDGQLVIVGDGLDYLRFGRGVFDIVNDPLLNALVMRNAIFVRGNHCPPAALLAEHYPRELICDTLIVGRMLFMHGHQGDLVNGRLHSIGDAIVRIGNGLGQLSPRVEDWVAAAAGKLTARGRYGDARMVREYAVEFAGGVTMTEGFDWNGAGVACGIEVVVCGHSHVKERGTAVMGDRKIEYVNCGTWKDGWTEV